MHANTIQSETRLAAFLHSTSRREEARRLHESALRKALQTKGEGDTLTTPQVRMDYGKSLLAEGRLEAAESLVAKVIESNRRNYPASAVLANGIRVQGALYTAFGRYAEAERLLDEAFAMWRKTSGAGADPSRSNKYLLDQAMLLVSRGDPSAGAGRLSMIAIPKNASHLPLVPEQVEAEIVLAQAYLEQGRRADSLASARDALSQIQRSSVRDYYQTLEADASLALGEAQEQAGDPKEARVNLQRALDLRENNDDRTSPWLAEAAIALAGCLIDLGERPQAQALLAQAKAIHATHEELGEHFRRPLRDLERRLAQQG